MANEIGVGIAGFWHVHADDYARQATEHPGTRVVAGWDADPELRAQIPDPNALDSFRRSAPAYGAPHSELQQQWLALYRRLLHVRADEIIPRLSGDVRSAGVTVLGEGAVSASWQMGDQSLLRIDINLGATPVAAPPLAQAKVLFQQGLDEQALAQGVLPARTAIASIREAI